MDKLNLIINAEKVENMYQGYLADDTYFSFFGEEETIEELQKSLKDCFFDYLQNEGKEIQRYKNVLLNFSVRLYEDYLLCDLNDFDVYIEDSLDTINSELEKLNNKANEHILFGEFIYDVDINIGFDIGLKNVSHLIKDLELKDNRYIYGNICFLENANGRDAKFGLENKVSRFRMRAVHSNKILKNIFTFDIVS